MWSLRYMSLALAAKIQLEPSARAWAFSGKYSADYDSVTCVRECQPGSSMDNEGKGKCGGPVEGPWVPLYDTLKECCEKDLFWRRHCIPESLGTVFYTNKYYVHPDWRNEKCVRDCDPSFGPPCRGNPPDASGLPADFFDNADECCKAKVWWNGSCVANSHGVPPPPTYPDPTAKPTPANAPPTVSPTPLPTPVPTPVPTPFPTPLPTPLPVQVCSVNSDCFRVCEPVTGQCVAAPTGTPTVSPTVSPVGQPTVSPTTSSPSRTPSSSPSKGPSLPPSVSPTRRPSDGPTGVPTKGPTSSPSNNPTSPPTTSPTHPTTSPTTSPTHSPVNFPTNSPTKKPTISPSKNPTSSPTSPPSSSPSGRPTVSPSQGPTPSPSVKPTASPTPAPSNPPTPSPSNPPTPAPSNPPTTSPSDPLTPPPSNPPTPSPSIPPTPVPSNPPTTSPSDTLTPPPSNPPTPSPSNPPTPSPSNPPTPSPSNPPTPSPSNPPTPSPSNPPTPAPSNPPTPAPTNPPTLSPVCQCVTPKTVPDVCEIGILMDAMEQFVSSNHALLGQWLRAAFHDAGSFDQTVPEGGANGCLLNHLPMRQVPENNFFDAPILTLQDIKEFWHDHDETCIDVSSADIIQFAGFFSTMRQVGVPGLTVAKRNAIINSFAWGRPDESSCDPAWASNLPGFRNGAPGNDIPARCTAAGAEIKEKMMDRNGFTAQEATALIGGHTIGTVRNTFGAGLAGPWVNNGADNATPDGPVMDNAYHDFLINTIVANNANQFASNVSPFDTIFPDWFREESDGLDHLDTDVTLAFPSLDTNAHPSFNGFSQAFANDNGTFLSVFFLALDKMSKLGVSVTLSPPGACGCSTTRRRSLQAMSSTVTVLMTSDLKMLAKMLGNSTAHADGATTDTQYSRMNEVVNITTKVDMSYYSSSMTSSPIDTISPAASPMAAPTPGSPGSSGSPGSPFVHSP